MREFIINKIRESPDRLALVVVVLFFLTNALTQWLVSPTADLDQSQQLVLSQSFELGYGKQPPLYTWLVILLFELTGPALLPLFGLKAGILCLLALMVVKVAHEINLPAERGALAVIGLFLIPQISWEAQRDLTHSVLATSLSACTLWIVLRIRTSPLRRNYYILGGLIGLGILSKYNYLIFVAGLCVTAFITTEFRARLFSSNILITFFMALALILPHLAWVADNIGTVMLSQDKLKIDESIGTAFGVAPASRAVLAFLGPLAATYFICCLDKRNYPWRSTSVESSSDGKNFLIRLAIVLYAIIILIAFVTGATHIKDRWMQPLFFFVPILIAALHFARPRIFIAICLCTAIIITIMLPSRTLFPDTLGAESRPNLPYACIVREIRKSASEPKVIISDQRLLGGNMRLQYPNAQVIIVNNPKDFERVLTERTGSSLIFLTDNRDRDSLAFDWPSYFLKEGISLNVSECSMLYSSKKSHRVFWRFFGN